jgi:DNA-binding transcriptional ArsR family regulator
MIANVSRQTASNHLRLLLEAGFLKANRVGRNRFYQLGAPTVGVALESLAAAASGKANAIVQQTAPELAFARTCYDHLAGEPGVAILKRLLHLKYTLEEGKDYRLTSRGEEFFVALVDGVFADSVTAAGVSLKACRYADYVKESAHGVGCHRRWRPVGFE